jgi:hypothetical protein
MRLRRMSLGKILDFNMYIVYSCLLNDISQERTKVRLHGYKYEKILHIVQGMYNDYVRFETLNANK